MMPATAPRITNDTRHITILTLQSRILMHIGHYQRSKYTVFLCSLTDILQSKFIILSSVPFTFYGIHTAVVPVFIITKKVHTDKVHTKILIIFKEAVDVLLSAFMTCYYPPEAIVGVRIKYIIFTLLITQILEGNIISTLYNGFFRTMYPQRIVIDTQFQSLSLAHFRKFLQFYRSVFRHISRRIGLGSTIHRHKTIRTNHIVTIRKQIFRHIVDYILPGTFRHINSLSLPTGIDQFFISALQFPTVFIDTPIERGVISMYSFRISVITGSYHGIIGNHIRCPACTLILASSEKECQCHQKQFHIQILYHIIIFT